MKIEAELSDKLCAELSIAAKDLKMSRKRFITKVIKNMAESSQKSGEDIIAELTRFFEKYPDANIPWWEDRGWKGIYRSKS